MLYLQGKETLEDCIGCKAGPCLDQTVVEMLMNPQKQGSDSDSLAVAKRKVKNSCLEKFIKNSSSPSYFTNKA